MAQDSGRGCSEVTAGDGQMQGREAKEGRVTGNGPVLFFPGRDFSEARNSMYVRNLWEKTVSRWNVLEKTIHFNQFPRNKNGAFIIIVHAFQDHKRNLNKPKRINIMV